MERSIERQPGPMISESWLTRELRGAYMAGFEASGEGYNGELMRDGLNDEKAIRKKAYNWARRKVVRRRG